MARHERSYGRYQQVLDLEHYLEVLERKPGALAGSTPLQQWRERGRWPASFDRLWQSLAERRGRAAGTRAMIELLSFGKRHGWDRLQQANRTSAGAGLHGFGRGAPSAELQRTGASAPGKLRGGDWAGTLRASRTHHE